MDDSCHGYKTNHCQRNYGDRQLQNKSSGICLKHSSKDESTCPCLVHRLKMILRHPTEY